MTVGSWSSGTLWLPPLCPLLPLFLACTTMDDAQRRALCAWWRPDLQNYVGSACYGWIHGSRMKRGGRKAKGRIKLYV
ncbi:hypothetical protein C2845_PM03G33560 [Panicum miliaceum]|uniref:Uncharacterized protein n=1 Tax=Panicum miliaceum TaxID=4540 RepID=A0A3L6TEZ0_PANMI|nr:hypothetical protein C2845_PM03G33560 [Panicum miliaceum]